MTVSLVDVASTAQRLDRKDLEGSLLPQSGPERVRAVVLSSLPRSSAALQGPREWVPLGPLLPRDKGRLAAVPFFYLGAEKLMHRS